MKTNKRYSILIILILWSTTFLFSQNVNLSAGKSQNIQKEYLGQQANEKIPGTVFIQEGLNSSFPSFVKFDETHAIPFRNFFSWAKKSLDNNPAIDFNLLKQEKDELGFVNYRYEQTFKGIPVAQSNYIIHVKNGNVISFNGQVFEIPSDLSPTPALKSDAALIAAKNHVGAQKYMWEDPYWENNIKEKNKNNSATYFPVIELCWYPADFNVSGKTVTYKLAYRLDLYAASPNSSNRIFVDAKTGAILNTFPLESNCTSATVSTIFNGSRTIFTDKYTGTNWRLRDDCQAPKFRVRDWNSTTTTPSALEIENATNTWTTMNERFGGTVLWELKQSYLYWLNARGRASYDNANGNVEAYINAIFGCTPPPTPCYYPDNASMSFSGGTMKVGLGSSGTLANSFGALDIIAHEFTHAVTGTSAMLTYANESGALNESFSDIFGESTENYALGSNDWLLGNDRTSGAIRSMFNPKSHGQPDTYLGTNWTTAPGDNGGVHTNSGVQNLWFYLLAQGGSGTNDNNNSYNVTGVGLGSASAIAARSLIVYLTTSSVYTDARTASINAATDLFGACSNEVRQTTNAWYAVGVGAQFFYVTATATSNFNGWNVSCATSCNGTAVAAAFNGFGGYKYSWSTGATTGSVTGLCGTTYTVTVTDNLGTGCTATTTVTLTAPPALTAVSSTTTNFNGFNISCNGGSNGQATVTPGGGTPGYTYLWTNGQSTQTATGLSAITYNVTVTDANGCMKTTSVKLTQPPALSVTAAPTSSYNGYNVSCNGGSDGSAAATPSGGVGPFTYNWSGGITGNPVSGLSAVTYTVTVTDANGCTATASTTLTEPPLLNIDAGSNKIVYYGYPDSACATLTAAGASGGVPPYSLLWSTGSTLSSITVCPIVSTVYYVTIKDINDCTFKDSVRVCVIDVRCGGHLDKVLMCRAKGKGFETKCMNLKEAKEEFTDHPGSQLGTCGIVKVCTYTSPRLANTGLLEDLSNDIYAEGTFLGAFPNPFSANTTIKFILHENDKVGLKVFDISGKEIAILYKGTVDAETVYEVSFDGSGFANGIYFLNLNTQNGENRVIKLIIAR